MDRIGGQTAAIGFRRANSVLSKPVMSTIETPRGNNGRLDWDGVVSALYDDVMQLALKLCQSRAQAEDLAQDTFLRAWRFQHTLRDAAAVKPWLFTILRNENNRRFKRCRLESQDFDAMAGTRDHEPDRRVESYLLRRAIFELGHTYREPLLLQVFGGYTGKEIADQLDLNDNTVTTRLFRAKAKLNRKLIRKR